MSEEFVARQRAAMLIDAGRPSDALGILAPLAASGPEDPDVHLLTARALIALRRFGDAKKAARRALSLQPGDATALRLISVASINSGDPDSGGDEARRARFASPQDWRTHYLVAIADSGAKNVTADTRASVDEALRLAPDFVEPRFAAGLVAQTSNDWASAARWYRAALEVDPNHRDARNNLAVLQLRRGAHGDAARTFADLLGEDPRSERSQRNVAVAYRTAMRWSVSLTLSAAAIRNLAVFGQLDSTTPSLEQVFSAVMAGIAVVTTLVIGTRFVTRLGRHRRAILGTLLHDRRVFSSVVAVAASLVCLVTSFLVLPVESAMIAFIAAVVALHLYRSAVAQARH